MRVLLVSPTALDFHGRPITQGRVHLPALTLPLLAAVTPRHVELRLVIETAERVPLEEHWDLVGLTGMGSGIVRLAARRSVPGARRAGRDRRDRGVTG